jgi:hypothetical protein
MTVNKNYLMTTWIAQARLFLSDNIAYVIAGLFVVALIGAVLAYPPYVDPGTETTEIEESSWSSTAGFTHQAIVTEQTDIFKRGEILSGRESYLKAVSPELNGTFRYQYQASEAGDIAVAANLTLVMRSVAEEGPEYWRTEQHLASANESSLGPDEQIAVPYSMNVTAVTERIAEIEEQLGGTPGSTEIIVRSDLVLAGERNGVTVDTQTAHNMTISTQGNVYSIEGAEPVRDSGQQFREETTEMSYGPLRTALGPLLVVVSILGVVGLAVGHLLDWWKVTERDRRWFEYQSTRAEFDEWITDGDVPPAVDEKTTIDVQSLKGLVDVAIDSDRRVIADQSRSVCVVVLEDAVYRFDPPAPPAGTQEPLVAGESQAVSGAGADGGTDALEGDNPTAGSDGSQEDTGESERD